jgi:glutathione synthase/RimK-type ligase-like ATP-grasp enzyme
MTNVWVLINEQHTSMMNHKNVSIVNEFQNRNIDCFLIHAQSLTTNDGLTLEYGVMGKLTPPDLVFINGNMFDHKFITDESKINESDRQQLLSVLDILESMKPQTLFVNDVVSQRKASLKHEVYEILAKTNVVMPHTKVSYDWDDSDEFIDQILQEFQFPVVTKATQGVTGDTVRLSRDRSELKNDLQIRKTKSVKYKKPIIFQEYEKDSEGLLIKARLVGDKIEAVYRMYSPFVDDVFKAEEEYGRMGIAMQVDQPLRDIVLEAAAALNIEVAWFDLFYSKGVYKFCEVNAPGGVFNSIYNNTNFAVETVDYCLKRLEEHRNGQ